MDIKLVWENAKRKVNDLIPWDGNPRKMSETQVANLKSSLEKYNLAEIPAIDIDNKIVAGHQRLKIMQMLGRGEEEIDVRIPNRKLTDEEFQGYNIASNKVTGEFDWDLLCNIDERILLDNGFTEKEILDGVGLKETEEVEVPATPTAPTSKLGEIYQLGEHRLMCGSATDKEAVLRLLEGKKAGMVFTDPPYNVDYDGKDGSGEDRTILNDKMSKENFYAFLKDAITNMMEVTTGAFYICMSSSELHTLNRAFTDAGGHWSTFIIWVKDRFTMGRADYQRQYEPILYGWKEGAEHYFVGVRNNGDVWSVKRAHKNDLHPTMKPIELVAKAIENSSREGDIVLDTFGGSGSTLIACEQLKRKCYTMELDEKYCDVIRQRYADYIEKKAKEAEQK